MASTGRGSKDWKVRLHAGREHRLSAREGAGSGASPPWGEEWGLSMVRFENVQTPDPGRWPIRVSVKGEVVSKCAVAHGEVGTDPAGSLAYRNQDPCPPWCPAPATRLQFPRKRQISQVVARRYGKFPDAGAFDGGKGISRQLSRGMPSVNPAPSPAGRAPIRGF
jgi:hypothetical protein